MPQILIDRDLCGGEPRCVPFCPTQAIEYLPLERV